MLIWWHHGEARSSRRVADDILRADADRPRDDDGADDHSDHGDPCRDPSPEGAGAEADAFAARELSGGDAACGAMSVGRLAVAHGVLRAADVAELRDAASVLRDAGREAAAIVAEARREAARILDQARVDAEAHWQSSQDRIEAACEAGRAEGERQAAHAWHERQADHAVDKAKAVRGLHDRLAEVVTSAVERIVQTESRAALYQRALRSVQSLSRDATALTLRVNAGDVESAREGIAAVAELAASGLTVEVVADGALPPGSCRFESDLGVVDAGLHTQLDALRAAMSRAVRRAVAE